MNFNYKSILYAQKLDDLQDYYKTSVAFAQALGVTRMTLVAWRDHPQKIKLKNQDKIDLLWCKYIFLPKMNSGSEIVKGVELGDFLFEPAVMDKSIRNIAAGSLEIETGTQELDFNTIVLDNIVPNNFHATSVAEVQNIHHITQEIVQNFQVEINLQQVKDWHKVLMRGLINNAGEFSSKQRVLPNVDTQLTHPDDIVEELENWAKDYANIQHLSEVAKSHYHFEIIHPFSDGNGRIGRLIILAQCLKIGIKPPIINNNNKALYYILLEYTKINPTPLAYFFQACSK
ncbi:MAG: Fic family protein [Gammaproteobacteria bacterium]|nr:Fic family protein [Gammaproteobacteria bacterium]